MSWGAVIVGGATLIGGAMSSNSQKKAANKAADAQLESTRLGIAEQQRQFDAIQKLLAPYVQAGNQAIGAQGNLIGLNGNAKQAAAIKALESSPQFTSLVHQGENAILQNASATGGLRGGNVQAALGQFRPSMLSSLIQQQFDRLGGFTSLGQNAAAGVGNAGMQTGSAISGLLQQQGAARAGAALAGGRAQANTWNSAANAVGLFGAMGGFNGFGGSGRTTTAESINPSTPGTVYNDSVTNYLY